MSRQYPRVPILPLLAGAFLAGVVWAATVGGAWWQVTILAGLVSAALQATPRFRSHPMLLVAVVILVAFGHARFDGASLDSSTAAATVRGEHDVIGVIRDDPRVRGLFTRVDLNLEQIDGEPSDGSIRVTLRAPLDPLETGERLRLFVDLEDPPDLEAFDYAAYLASRGIFAVGAFPKSWSRIGRAEDGRSVFRALRGSLNANIERTLPPEESALAAGVLVGERGQMPEALTDALRRTGTTHLVVVSGQNVALLLGIAITVLTMAVPRRRAAMALLFALPLYVALVGADPPVVRAAVMAVGIVIASALGRRTPGWIYLVYAAALMVAWDPRLATDVAFQLSATATAGVMIVAPALTAWILARLEWSEEGGRATLVELAATATGATLAVLPVQVATFERISVVAVPANVMVAPLYEATVAVAAIAAVAGLTDLTASAARPLLTFVPAAFIWIVEQLARIPGGEFPARAPLLAGAAWYAGLTAVTWLLDRRSARAVALEPARHTAYGWPAGLGVVAIGLWLAVLQPTPEGARVTFLDVGHGLAVLVEDGGQRVLFDAGTPDGAAILAMPPGVSRIDAVLVSHADTDHAGGIAPLMDRLEVGVLLADERTLEDLRERLPEASAGLVLDIGDTIELSDRTSIEVLAPPVVTRGRAHASANDASMVIRVTIGDRVVLVTADIEAAAENWLVESGTDLGADVVLIPHQGSKTSSTPAFLEAVAPAAAVLSAGVDNPYGHPAPEVMARYEGIPIYRTDQQGNITVTSDGDRLWIRAERE